MTRQDVTDHLRSMRPDRMRSYNEVHARYVKGIEQYRALMERENDPREQRLMLYNEIKALGWVLGKTDQKISIEIAG